MEKCRYSETVPGDCHVACKRWKFTEPKPYSLICAINRLPAHAGIFPLVFNEDFICPACPYWPANEIKTKEAKSDAVKENYGLCLEDVKQLQQEVYTALRNNKDNINICQELFTESDTVEATRYKASFLVYLLVNKGECKHEQEAGNTAINN